MDNNYLKTGEFAKICGVNKATLVHYADIGLLKPVMIGEENGYFYYSPAQIYDFEIIHVLKSMNVPLSEIKDYLENKRGNLPACKEVLKKKLKELQDYQAKLHSVELLVQNTIQDMEDVDNQKIGIVEEITFDEPEYYYIYEMPSRTTDAVYIMNNTRDVIKHVQESFSNERINVIEIVLKEDILNETYRKKYGGFIAKKDSQTNESTFVRPKGTYLTIADYRGGYQIPMLYAELKQYADYHGYKIVGHGYEKDQLSHIVKRDDVHYLVRCYIQVEKIER